MIRCPNGAWALSVVACLIPACERTEPASLPSCDDTWVPSFSFQEVLPRPNADYRALSGNLRFMDLDADGRRELFVHEADNARITVLFSCETECREQTFSDRLRAPVRSHVVDLDRDGDRDLVVSDIGSLIPSDEPVGRVLLMRAEGDGSFEVEVLLEDVGRVVSAEAADLDGDADLDIVVCEFGHEALGSLWWLEQTDSGFTPHELDPIPGAIHGFPVDIDADRDLDIVAVFSQDTEAVKLFENDGSGVFTSEVLFASDNTQYGMSGIEPTDLDRDGDIDILVTNGDYLDTIRFEADDTFPEEHGLAWLENRGGNFIWHDILRMPAAYAVRAADLDGDCDRDLVLGNLVRDNVLPVRYRPPSLNWLENDGAQNFTPHSLLDSVEPIVTLDVHDVDADGRPDIAFGALGDNVRGTRGSLARQSR